MKRIVFAFLALISLTDLGYAQNGDNGFTDLSKPLSVTKNSPTVTLKLKSNPTTGYSWYLSEYNPQFLEPLSAKYIAPTSQLVGAPGYMLWKFRVKQNALIVPTVISLTMIYARPWDLSDASSKHQIFLVTETQK